MLLCKIATILSETPTFHTSCDNVSLESVCENTKVEITTIEIPSTEVPSTSELLRICCEGDSDLGHWL